MLYDLFSCFRSENKLLSWPKTNCVVKVLLAGTIVFLWALPLSKGLIDTACDTPPIHGFRIIDTRT